MPRVRVVVLRARRALVLGALVLVMSLGFGSAAGSQGQDPQEPPQPPPSERVELVSQRSEYGRVFRNSDGTMTAEAYSQPINFQTTEGTWTPVDPTLMPASVEGFAWRNVGGPLQLRFAESARPEGTVSVAVDSGSIAFGLEGSSLTSLGQATENRITYADALPGVDLVYESQADALKELIVLREAPREQPSFRFSLTLRGLTPREEADGSISILDADGHIELVIPPAFMVDSSADPQSAEPAYSEGVELGITRTEAGYQLAVIPDLEWLRDPRRVYPVEIDPTVTRPVSLDTFVQVGITSSQASSDELKAGTFDGGTTKARSLVRFDLTGLHGKHILSADFSLFEWHSWSCTASQVNASRVTESWGSNANWTNQPTATSAFDTLNVAKGFSGSCPDGRIFFDATTPVTNWTNGTSANYGIRVRADDESNNNGWKKFRSENFATSSTHPKLEVTYNSYPLVPISLTPADGTISTSTTPTLSAVYRDPDSGDVGHVDYQICSTSSCVGSVVASGSGTLGVNPGQASPWSVPSGVLTSGQRYWWRARSDDGVDVSKSPEWTAPAISFGPNRAPPVPGGLTPSTGLGTSLTPEFAAVYSDPDANDQGVVQFEVYNASTSSLVTSGSSSTVAPGERATWTPSTALSSTAEYYWRAWSDDGLQQSAETDDMDLVIRPGGDVYHALLYTDDPSSDGELLSEEWARINSQTARFEEDDLIQTRDVADCPASYPSGTVCEEVRSLTVDTNPRDLETYSVYTARRGHPRLDSVSSLLDAATDPSAAPSATGALSSVLASWQTAPPESSSSYALYESTDPDSGDVTRLWVEGRTLMPVKGEVRTSTSELLDVAYWTYEEDRLDVASLPSDFFAEGSPASVGFEEIVEIHGDGAIAALTDLETSESFEPFYLGSTTVVEGTDGTLTPVCLVDFMVVRTTLAASEMEAMIDPDAEIAPDPSALEDTYVSANYAPDTGTCVPGQGDNQVPVLSVMSVAEGSSLAAAARGAMVEPAEVIEGDPEHPTYARAGVRGTQVLSSLVSAYVLASDDARTSALIEPPSGNAVLVLNGDFDKITLVELASDLEQR